MDYTFETYFLLFIIYSFIGWAMESIKMIFHKDVRHFVNRGFLIGPYLPIYGFGVLLITILLSKYSKDIPALFWLSMITCGILEYFTSYIMEKIFNARWWDYSSRKFNINGRICLETLVPFGIAGVITISFLNPLFINLLVIIPDFIRHIISIILISIILIDVLVTTTIVAGLKDTVDILSSADDTEEISAYVKDKAEDMAMQLESDITRHTRKRIIKNKRKVLHAKLRTTKHLQEVKNHSAKINQKITSEITNKVQNVRLSTEELTIHIKSKFSKKSLLHKRLIEAFPTLKFTEKIKNKFNKK